MSIRVIEVYTEQMAKLNAGEAVDIDLNSDLTVRLVSKKVSAPKKVAGPDLQNLLRSRGYRGPTPTAAQARRAAPVSSQDGLPHRVALEAALAELPDPLLGIEPEPEDPPEAAEAPPAASAEEPSEP